MLKNKLLYLIIPIILIIIIIISLIIFLPKSDYDPDEFKDGEPRDFPVTLDD